MSEIAALTAATASSSSDASYLASGRIPSLDGMRAVAIGLVLLAHARRTHSFPTPVARIAARIHGEIGVEVFFVISGFLITTLILRERERRGALDVRGFYFRRALRILPAYISFLCVVLLLENARIFSLQARDWIAALTYTMNFVHDPSWQVGHTWSLSIEEHFYLIWPMVMLARPALARGFAVGMIAACFLARWVVLLVFPRLTPMAELWTFTRLDTIAFGCLLALLAWMPEWRDRLDQLCATRWRVLTTVGMLVFFMAARSVSAKLSVGFGYTLISATIAVLLWAAIRNANSFSGRILNHPIAAGIGVGSYSLYLWQQIFLDPTRNTFVSTFPQNLLFAISAACASYWCVERPFLKMKDKIGSKRHGTTATRIWKSV
jgi:peptidoglycan/LPS O-acetylase OafA/YrhL